MKSASVKRELPQVVLLGSQSWGSGLIALPAGERNCEILGMVDDYRAKYGLKHQGVPVITVTDFALLAAQNKRLIAINTCVKPAPKTFFDQLCEKHHVRSLDFRQTLDELGLHEKLAKWEPPKPLTLLRQRLSKAVHAKVRRGVDFWAAGWGWRRGRGAGVLLVNLDGIGALNGWGSHAASFRERVRGGKITLLCDELYADHARTLPHWDAVMAVNANLFRRDLGYRLKTMRSIRRGGYEQAINATRVRNELDCDAMIRSSRAARKIYQFSANEL